MSLAHNSGGGEGEVVSLAKLASDQKSGAVRSDLPSNQQIIMIVNAFISTSRIRFSQNRRNCRQPFTLDRDMDKNFHALAHLLQKMDFQVIRRFTEMQVMKLVQEMTILVKKPDEFIYHKGDVSNAIYAIFIGEVDILGPVDGDPVKRFTAGLSFGDDVRYGQTRRNSAVAHTYTIMGVIDKQSFFAGKTEQRVMEDSKLMQTIKNIVPFCALHHRDLQEFCVKLEQVRAPGRMPVCGNSNDLSKYLVVVMSGTFEVRCQVLVTAANIGTRLLPGGKPLAFSDVPVIMLKKGSMWNVDLVMPEYDMLGNLESRKWVENVEFSHYNIYPREDAKCILVPMRDAQKFVMNNNLTKRWFSTYAKLFHTTKRISVFSIVQLLCKPDFVAKTSGYMKEILANNKMSSESGI